MYLFVCSGWSVWSDSWVGLTLICDVPQPIFPTFSASSANFLSAQAEADRKWSSENHNHSQPNTTTWWPTFYCTYLVDRSARHVWIRYRYVLPLLPAQLLQSLPYLSHVLRLHLNSNVTHNEVVVGVHGRAALDQLQAQVAKRQPDPISGTKLDKIEALSIISLISVCTELLVKVWRLYTLHSNYLCVEVEALVQVAHHDSQVVHLNREMVLWTLLALQMHIQ